MVVQTVPRALLLHYRVPVKPRLQPKYGARRPTYPFVWLSGKAYYQPVHSSAAVEPCRDYGRACS